MSESYTVGGDMLYLLDPVTLIGQTFSPLIAHNLEFIDLNAKRLTISGDISITLHDLDNDPNMVGGGISQSKYATWSKRMFWDVSRVRFKMAKVAVNPGTTYGILIHHTRTPWWNYHHVQYDINNATYPRGKRFTKDSLLDPPTYYPNDDLIFTEFGDPPTPPTPPDPPIDNFMILTVGQINTQEGFKFIVVTNVPCHLYMLWTNHEPWTHIVPGIRRGIAMVKEAQYCFVDWISNQQLEPGDTMVHTFVKEPWAICETRWFTFRAKVNDVWSPSVGPIFKKHRIAPLPGEEHLFPLLEYSSSYRSLWKFEDNEWDEKWSAPLSEEQWHWGIEVETGFSAPLWTAGILTRQALAFDTRELPSGAHIISAKIAFRHVWTKDTIFPRTVYLQRIALPHPTDPCANAGWYYGNYDGNAGEHTFTEMPPMDTLIEIPLTLFGLVQIQHEGITRFGLRMDKDIAGEEYRQIRIWHFRGFYDNMEPKLYITYSPPT